MKLIEWRRLHGFSQKQIAERLGIQQSTVAKYEAGKLIPGRDSMMAIAGETGGAVTPNDFFDLPATEAA